MDLNITRIISYTKLFIILMYFLDKTSCLLCIEKPDLSILKTICIIRKIPKDMGQLPTHLKCTAIGVYSDEKGILNSAHYRDIDKFRNGLPFVYNQNDYSRDEILRNIRPQNLDKFLKKQNKLIIGLKINVMIFDILYTSRDIQKYEEQLNKNADQIRVHSLFRALKIHHPNVLLGMMISYEENYVDDINLAYYDSVIDFYAYDTVTVSQCWNDVAITTTLDALSKIIKHMESIGFNINKSIITIELHISDGCITYVNNYIQHTVCNIQSYDNYCSHKNTGDHICDDTLANYYQKGLLVNTYNLSGAIIKSITDDDYGSKCGCGPFAGLTVIDAGIRGSPEPKDITNCKTWGHSHN